MHLILKSKKYFYIKIQIKFINQNIFNDYKNNKYLDLFNKKYLKIKQNQIKIICIILI